jgi:hypothetical protein
MIGKIEGRGEITGDRRPPWSEVLLGEIAKTVGFVGMTSTGVDEVLQMTT